MEEPERPAKASREDGSSRARTRREAEPAVSEIALEQLRKGRCSGKMLFKKQFHGTGKKRWWQGEARMEERSGTRVAAAATGVRAWLWQTKELVVAE